MSETDWEARYHALESKLAATQSRLDEAKRESEGRLADLTKMRETKRALEGAAAEADSKIRELSAAAERVSALEAEVARASSLGESYQALAREGVPVETWQQVQALHGALGADKPLGDWLNAERDNPHSLIASALTAPAQAAPAGEAPPPDAAAAAAAAPPAPAGGGEAPPPAATATPQQTHVVGMPSPHRGSVAPTNGGAPGTARVSQYAEMTRTAEGRKNFLASLQRGELPN